MRKESKNTFFSKKNMVSIFIVFIMVSSVIGYMFGESRKQSFKYKDYKFYQDGRVWTTKINGLELVFDYFPGDVEDIQIADDAAEKFRGLIELDTTSDPDDRYAQAISVAQYSLQQNLAKISNTYLMIGMSDENEFNLPVLNCKNATQLVPMLYFKRANSTNVEFKENCLIASANSEIDVLRIKDRLLYGILGII